MTTIVTVNVSQTIAPTPSTLQQTGAFVSQGATIIAPGTYSLLTQLSDLTPLLKGSATISTMAWSLGVVTVTTSAAHGFTISDTLELTIAGVAPVGYNGTFLCTVTTSTQFTYLLAANPGSVTTQGVYTPEDVTELNQMATSFFGMGSQTAVYVLELGAGNASDGVTALSTFITANSSPQFFYSYLLPRTWDGNSSFLSFLAGFQSTTSKTYFFITTTLTNYALYTSLMKCVVPLIESPVMQTYLANVLTAISWTGGVVTATTTTAHGISVGTWFQIQGCVPVGYNGWFQAQAGTTGSTLVYNLTNNPGTETALGTLEASTTVSTGISSLEFSLATAYQKSLSYAPSSNNRVTPFAFSYLFGVTAFPTKGLSALLATLKSANVNIVGTGAEGGISNTIILWGTTADGRDFTYWYSVDWAAINLDLAVSNVIINGSNNPLAPLQYDQDGIDKLQDAAKQVIDNAITVGLAIGQTTRSALNAPAFSNALQTGVFNGQDVVNAVPFNTYTLTNPGDFKIGKYSGIGIQYIPSRGFISVIINLNVTDLIF